MTITLNLLARDLGPAVVGLRARTLGSGVVVAPGIALTLARNVRGGTVALTVAGQAHEARVAGVDAAVDLAVLTFPPEASPVPIAWSERPPAIGDEVVALGDPGGRGLRITRGSVASAPRPVRGPGGRLIDGTIEHTAPLPRGAAGGPLLDAAGTLIGLNALHQDIGLLLAWPVTALRERALRMAAGERTGPATLGVTLSSPRHARRLRAAAGLEPVDGLLVRAVEPGSAADRAGVTRGDVLVAVGGTALAAVDPLFAALDAASDSPLELRIRRANDELTLTVTLDEATEVR